ncbi:MAG: TauD/TfdA family dioxygenase, partial [Rhodococcus sp. (in: high G+C Gram-positive bacteria)]
MTTIDTAVALTLDKLGPRFGAEVIGLDISSASDAEVLAVRQALVEHKVLVLRGQSLDDSGQIDFGR